MNNFTIDELDILQVLIKNAQKRIEGSLHIRVLEQLADKCTEAKIDLGFGQESLDDKI